MSDKRNDNTHFPAVNGRGHKRRKVVNLPNPDRYGVDPVEARALEIIGELVGILHDLEVQR